MLLGRRLLQELSGSFRLRKFISNTIRIVIDSA